MFNRYQRVWYHLIRQHEALIVYRVLNTNTVIQNLINFKTTIIAQVVFIHDNTMDLRFLKSLKGHISYQLIFWKI